jgi:hypothetical protein
MQRRTLLKYTALASGAAVTGPLLTIILSGCQADPAVEDLDYKPVFFSDTEFRILRKLVDIILPKTDSPAASEVGVHRIIDNMIGTVYQPEERLVFRDSFQILLAQLNGGTVEGETYDRLAGKLSAQQVQALHASNDPASKVAKSVLLGLKQQTVAYYLSTKEVGTNFLNYLPVPGQYEACVKLADVGGKAWAL